MAPMDTQQDIRSEMIIEIAKAGIPVENTIMKSRRQGGGNRPAYGHMHKNGDNMMM